MNLFPYSAMREVQEDLINEVENCLKNKKNLIVHAPTGLGKTVATLAPALKYALDNKKTIFFLTSRHTQHKIAIETLQDIRNKFNLKFVVADMIGKKWMCAQSGTDLMTNSEFNEYCEKQVEESKCEFYNNTKTKNKLSVLAKKVLEEIKAKGPCHTEDIYQMSKDSDLCPYEMSASLAADATVIVTDYYYLFHPTIKNIFLKRIGKEPEECIIIIDEAHNLGNRVRDLSTHKLSNIMIKRAIKEANKFNNDEIAKDLVILRRIFDKFSKKMKKNEVLITKEELIDEIKLEKDYKEMYESFQETGDSIREEQRASFIGSIGRFLEAWQGEDEGFVRIFSIKDGKEPLMMLSYRCLDPSIVTREVINSAYCTIAMSGTLNPTAMYRDLLGFENVIEKEFESPFPQQNKLSLIIPDTTTKFDLRNESQFKKMAKICSDITNLVPGNSAIFFPSYYLRDKIFNYFALLCDKTIFKEDSRATKKERFELIETFKSYNKVGSVLLGAASGSFGEGIDLPGDLLKCVIVVGLPLTQPDIEIQELIKYYDRKFAKGWDYGYLFPAFNKVLQNAGRCIRSETDKGVIVFLDERYTWPQYRRCFTKGVELKVATDYKSQITNFFK